MLPAPEKILHRLSGAISWRVRRVVGDDFVDRTKLALAPRWRPFLRKPVFVGVTGSVGKTTTKELLLGMLSRSGRAVGTVGSFNNIDATAQALLRLRPSDDFFVAELSEEKPGVMDAQLALLQPGVGVVTIVGYDHWSAYKFDLGAIPANATVVLGLFSSYVQWNEHTATIRAQKRTLLLETPRRTMLKLIASVESVRRTLDKVMMRRAIRQYLSATIRESEVDYLIEGAMIKKYANNEILFKEGDVADGLYLIRRGSVTVSRMVAGKEVVLSYVAAGNYVGEMALMSDAPRSATVRAAVLATLGRSLGRRRRALDRRGREPRPRPHPTGPPAGGLCHCSNGGNMIKSVRRLMLAAAFSGLALSGAAAQSNLRIGLAEDPDVLDPNTAPLECLREGTILELG